MTELERKVIEKATEEIYLQKFGFTTQFLNVHQIAFELDSPIVAKVEFDKERKLASVYFRVKDMSYYFYVLVDYNHICVVKWVNAMANHDCIFHAESETVALEDMLNCLNKTRPSSTWAKGSKVLEYNLYYEKSGFEIEINKGPGQFENKLQELLSYLELDIKGIKYLSEETTCFIGIESSFENDPRPGTFLLDYATIQKLNNLGLAIYFVININGKPII